MSIVVGHGQDRRRSRWWASGIGVVAAGLAVIMAAGPAAATPTPLASKYDRQVTDDGWLLELSASELEVNPMSNIANTMTSREGWITSRVGALITREGTQPVQAAVVEHVLVVGCQIDVSDGATLGLGFSIGPNVGVTISQLPGLTVGGSASVNPTISTTIKPGTISEISLGAKELQENRASIRIKQARVSVDGCLGPTTVRIIARFSVSTPTADDTLNVFSPRMWL